MDLQRINDSLKPHCPKCGEIVDRNDLYCGNCGEELLWNHKDNGESSSKYQYQKASTIGWLGVFFFIPAAWIVGIYLFTKENERAHKDGQNILLVSTVFFLILIWIRLFLAN